MKMSIKKEMGRIALLIVLAGVIVAGCGKKEDRSVEEIQSCGVLRAAVPDTQTMLFYQDEETDEYRGEEAELVEMIAEALGVSVQYLPVGRENFYGMLSTGEADIAIGSIMDSSSLTQNSLYSTPYGSGYIYIVTLRGFYVGDLGVFSNKTVGVSTQLAPESANALYAVDNIDIQSYDNTASVSADLTGGKIAGYLCYQSEAEDLLKQGEYQVQDAAGIERENYVILAPVDSATLLEGINAVIRQYTEIPREDS